MVGVGVAVGVGVGVAVGVVVGVVVVVAVAVAVVVAVAVGVAVAVAVVVAVAVGVAVAVVVGGVTTPRKPTRARGLGVTDEEYARLLDAQGGHCAICPATPKTRRLNVDHDHRTGAVRGLLCHRCNRALPNWVTGAWLYKAQLYLTDGHASV